MGTPISGRETIIGVKKATAWGTPLAAAANDGLLVTASGLGRGFAILEDGSLGAWPLDPQRGAQDAGGDLTGWLRYDNAEWVLLAILMGTAGAPSQQGATTAYLHTLQLSSGIPGLFATVAQKMKSDEVWEFPGVKPTSVKLTGGKRQATQFVIGTVASHLNRNPGTGVNNTTTIATVTTREVLRRIVMDENAYIRINAQGGAGLASTDAHPIGTYELTFARPQTGDLVLDGNVFITEPVGSDFVQAELICTFPVYEDKAAALLANFESDAVLKIELFARAIAEAGTGFPYSMTIQCPQAQVVGKPDITIVGPGKIAAKITFRLTKAAAAPTGMTGVTNPFAIKLINKRATDLLA